MDRSNIYDRCVYTSPAGLCSGQSPLHPNEHYLPAGLGNFKDDIHLKNFICCECQKRFGKYESVFLQNSPEAFFRRILGYKGRSDHPSKDIFVDPTHGIAPLTVKAPHPAFGHDVLFSMISQDNAVPLNQVVFKKGDGSLEYQPIRSGKLSQDLNRFGEEWKGWDLICCISGPADEEEVQRVAGPQLSKMQDVPLGVQSDAELTGRMQVQITLPYKQAISKIAFHFVLARFHFTGFEPEFDELKRFIYHGTGNCPLRTSGHPLLPAMAPDEARLRLWSHILTAEFNGAQFISRMQLFAGRRLKPPVLKVDLGRNPSRILSEMSQGFRFFYYLKRDDSGYAGAIEQLRLGPKIYVQSDQP
jgi:hypothetical protein